MTVAVVVGLVVLGGMIWLAQGVWRIGAVSTGRPIGRRSGTALLLVDLQTVFWDQGPYAEQDKDNVAKAIRTELDQARAQGQPIIAVRQEWSIPSTKLIARLTMKGQAVAGTDGTEIAGPFRGAADHVLIKRVQDAFETGALDALLERLDVGTLRIVGLDFCYCVLKTALAGRRRGYSVVVNRAGTLSATSPLRAEHALEQAGVCLE